MNQISVVVPVWNEEGNIQSLITRIDRALSPRFKYEIIVVDDHSHDNTVAHLNELASTYPIKVYEKQGIRGKAQSIIEGVAHAQAPIIAMIDGDLQYPPEAIPKMAQMIIRHRADIVVGNRVQNHTSIVRRVVHDSCRILLGRMLHNLDCDVQSGIKVFKRDICSYIEMNQSPWAFDLDFLVQARDHGYTIASYDIIFDKRHAGETKINLIEGTLEIALSAIRLKFKNHKVKYIYD